MAIAIVSRRIVIGWRHKLIDEMLDRCAAVDGVVEVDRTAPKLLDTLGRAHRIYKDKKEKDQIERIRYKDKIKQRDAVKYHVLKEQHAEYVELYKKLYPDSLPASVNQFLRMGAQKLWKLGKRVEAVDLTVGIGQAMKARQDEAWAKYRELYK